MHLEKIFAPEIVAAVEPGRTIDLFCISVTKVSAVHDLYLLS
jgi:hypothetical protein